MSETPNEELDSKDDDVLLSPEDAKAMEQQIRSGEPVDEPVEEEPEEDKSEDEPEDESAPDEVPDIDKQSKGYRAEIDRLRAKLREKRVSELSEGVQGEMAKVDKKKELLELGYTEDQIESLDKTFEIMAEAKGYVKQDSSYQSVINTTLSDFISQHKEYDPRFDKDDTRWTKFNEIINSGVYDYKTPKSKDKLLSILNRVHQDVQDELGEPENVNARDAAQRHKVRSAAHSGGSSTPKVDKKSPTVDKSVRHMFKGFDDEDFL